MLIVLPSVGSLTKVTHVKKVWCLRVQPEDKTCLLIFRDQLRFCLGLFNLQVSAKTNDFIWKKLLISCFIVKKYQKNGVTIHKFKCRPSKTEIIGLNPELEASMVQQPIPVVTHLRWAKSVAKNDFYYLKIMLLISL